MHQTVTPLFDDEQRKIPDANSSPISAYAAYNRTKQHVPVITPPPQNAHHSFASNGWPDRSSSSANLHQSQRSKQQGDSWRPHSPRSPHILSQDARRHGSAPQLNNTSPLPFQQNPSSPKNQRNRGSPGMPAQGKTPMTNSERRRQLEYQKKQNTSLAVNKTPVKSENKGSADLRGKKKSFKKNEKKSNENIELSIRTINTKGQSRESRNRVPTKEPGAPRDKAPRRNQRKSGDNGETKGSNEKTGKEESPIANKEIKTEIKTERPETPEDQLFVEDPISPEHKWVVADEPPITLKDLPITEESTEEVIREAVQDMISHVERQEKYEELMGPKTDESEYSTVSECDPSCGMKIRIASTRTSLEADLGIGQNDLTSSSYIWAERKIPSPTTSPVPNNKQRFSETMARMDAHNAEKALKKFRFKMFLPTAFNDFTFTETTITELYGLFQVSGVVMHFDEKGERLGSGCLKVDKDMCEKVKNWASNFPWKAISIQPLPKEPLSRLVVNMYLEHSCNKSDSCNQIMEKLTEEYGAVDYQILYNYEEKSLRTATFKMDRDIARALNKKLRYHGEVIFDNPNTIRMFEIVGLPA